MERRRIGATVDDGDANQDVVRIVLGVLDEDIEVAVLIEDAGVHQLIFGLQPRAMTIDFQQPRVRKFQLRIFVQALHVGVRGSGIQVIVIFFDVLAVIALRAAQAEEALLQNGIASIPEGECKTEALVIVTDAGDPVFGPAIGTRAGVVVGEIIPGRSISAVIFSRIAPRAFG